MCICYLMRIILGEVIDAINNIYLLFSSVQDFGINRTLSDRLEGMSAELLTPVASATKAKVQKVTSH